MCSLCPLCSLWFKSTLSIPAPYIASLRHQPSGSVKVPRLGFSRLGLTRLTQLVTFSVEGFCDRLRAEPVSTRRENP